jgi:hypothetical protein
MVEQLPAREIHRIGCWKASFVFPFLLLTTLGLLWPATLARHRCGYPGKKRYALATLYGDWFVQSGQGTEFREKSWSGEDD